MEERISDLSLREVIDLDSGRRLGRVRDALIDTQTGRVAALIVPGRLRCLGLLGREEEILLPWETLEKLGKISCWCAGGEGNGRGFPMA